MDPSVSDNLALKTACELKYINVVLQLLRDERVNPCAHSKVAVRIAGKQHNAEIATVWMSRVIPKSLHTILDGTISHRYLRDLLVGFAPRVLTEDEFWFLACKVGSAQLVKQLLPIFKPSERVISTGVRLAGYRQSVAAVLLSYPAAKYM